jgi:hypothetical protein
MGLDMDDIAHLKVDPLSAVGAERTHSNTIDKQRKNVSYILNCDEMRWWINYWHCATLLE